jgi:cytochrome c peroxidase
VDNKYLTLDKKLCATISTKIDTLSAILTEIEKTKDEKELMLKFKKTRKEYKKIEPFVEYYFQGLSRRITGPALPEIKTDDNYYGIQGLNSDNKHYAAFDNNYNNYNNL